MRHDHPVIGSSFHLSLPWSELSEARSAWYRRAPLLGEDDRWAERTWLTDGETDGRGR